MGGWRTGPERPRLPFCWHCSRRLYGRVFARVVGVDGAEHDIHKACLKACTGGRNVVLLSTTVRP